MRVLFMDVETSPALVWTFGFFKQYIRPDQVVEPPRMLCFAARFNDRKRTEFYSEFHNGHAEMVAQLHRVLDEADVVVHFNGKTFDEPWARTEILQAGLRPPSPYRTVDLYQQSKRFYLPSHKLEYVSTRLIPAGGKESTGGFSLWVRCMSGDPKAWRLMRKYNLQDVDMMMPVYVEMLPWMTSGCAASGRSETRKIAGASPMDGIWYVLAEWVRSRPFASQSSSSPVSQPIPCTKPPSIWPRSMPGFSESPTSCRMSTRRTRFIPL